MKSGRTGTSPFREWRRRLAYNLLPLFPPLGTAFISLFASTLRQKYTGDLQVLQMVKSREPFVLAFYHGRQFLLVRGLRGWPAAIMTSISYLGEIQSRVLTSFGYATIKGSRSRGGARVLVEMVNLVRNGHVGSFAVDGPRGPNKVVKPGAVYVAKKLGVPLVPVTTSAWPSVTLRSAWDQYLLPLPFSRSTIHFGEPLFLERDLSDESISKDCRELAAVLNQMEVEADNLTGRVRK